MPAPYLRNEADGAIYPFHPELAKNVGFVAYDGPVIPAKPKPVPEASNNLINPTAYGINPALEEARVIATPVMTERPEVEREAKPAKMPVADKMAKMRAAAAAKRAAKQAASIDEDTAPEWRPPAEIVLPTKSGFGKKPKE